MSLLGTKLKPFNATAFHQGEFVEVSDADAAGRWSIFFFYPADFSFVCPTELADLQEHYAELQKLGVEVFSVSADTHFVHMAWHEQSPLVEKVQYFMLADPTHEIATNFNNVRDSGLADRATFLIDPDGVIQYEEISADGVGRNADELVRKVYAAQYVREHPDQVCPAHWHDGEATLTPSVNLVGAL